MSSTNHNLLLIDDDPRHAKALRAALLATSEGPSECEWVRTLSSGLKILNHKEVWAIFLNLSLPDSRGIDTFDKLHLLAAAAPIVVLGGVDDEDICKTAMLHGAEDYLLEGHVDSYSFARAIRNILEREVARQELFIEKERAQVTLNSIGDAVLSTDISANVTYLNVVAEAMTGWPCKDAMGHALTEVFQIVDGASHRPAPNPMELAILEDKTMYSNPSCV